MCSKMLDKLKDVRDLEDLADWIAQLPQIYINELMARLWIQVKFGDKRTYSRLRDMW